MLRTDQRNCTSLKNTIRVDKIRTIPITKPIKQIRSYISRIIDRWNLVPVNTITRNSGINDKAKFINDENTFDCICKIKNLKEIWMNLDNNLKMIHQWQRLRKMPCSRLYCSDNSFIGIFWSTSCDNNVRAYEIQRDIKCTSIKEKYLDIIGDE